MNVKHAAAIAVVVYAVGAGGWIAWEHRAAASEATLPVEGWASFAACMTGPLAEGELASERARAIAAEHGTADWPSRCLPHAKAVSASLERSKVSRGPVRCLESSMRDVVGSLEKGELPGRGSLNRAYLCADELGVAADGAPDPSVPTAPSASPIFGPGPVLGAGALDGHDPPFGTTLRLRFRGGASVCRVTAAAAHAICTVVPDAMGLFEHQDVSLVPSAADEATHLLVGKSGAEGGGVYDLDRGERVIPAGAKPLNGAYVDAAGVVYAVGPREADDIDVSRFILSEGELRVDGLPRVPVRRDYTRVLGPHLMWTDGRRQYLRPLSETEGSGLALEGLGWLADVQACVAGDTTFGLAEGRHVIAARGDEVRVHELATRVPVRGSMGCANDELTLTDIGEGAMELWRCRLDGCGHERYERPDAGGALRRATVVGDTVFLAGDRGPGVRLAVGPLADFATLEPKEVYGAEPLASGGSVHGAWLVPRGDVAYFGIETSAGSQLFRVSRSGAVESVLPR